MAEEKKRIVNLYVTPSTFTSIFKKLRGYSSDYDFSGIADVRQLLSNEKAKILNIVKTQEPSSIYNLAKILNRDFKSVIQDVKILEKFGFIQLKEETKGKRKMLKPIVALDSLQINISFQ